MRDMTTGDPMSSAAAEWSQDSQRGPPQLIACSGQGKQGALSILRRGLVPELILEVPLPGDAPDLRHWETEVSVVLMSHARNEKVCVWFQSLFMPLIALVA